MIVSEGKEEDDEIKKNSSLSGGCFLLSTAIQSKTPPKAEGEGKIGLLCFLQFKCTGVGKEAIEGLRFLASLTLAGGLGGPKKARKRNLSIASISVCLDLGKRQLS